MSTPSEGKMDADVIELFPVPGDAPGYDPTWGYDIPATIARLASALEGGGSAIEMDAVRVLSVLQTCPHPETQEDLETRSAGNFFGVVRTLHEIRGLPFDHARYAEDDR